jgi:hypothetical protein
MRLAVDLNGGERHVDLNDLLDVDAGAVRSGADGEGGEDDGQVRSDGAGFPWKIGPAVRTWSSSTCHSWWWASIAAAFPVTAGR